LICVGWAVGFRYLIAQREQRFAIAPYVRSPSLGEHNHPEIAINSIPLAEHRRHDTRTIGGLAIALVTTVKSAS